MRSCSGPKLISRSSTMSAVRPGVFSAFKPDDVSEKHVGLPRVRCPRQVDIDVNCGRNGTFACRQRRVKGPRSASTRRGGSMIIKAGRTPRILPYPMDDIERTSDGVLRYTKLVPSLVHLLRATVESGPDTRGARRARRRAADLPAALGSRRPGRRRPARRRHRAGRSGRASACPTATTGRSRSSASRCRRRRRSGEHPLHRRARSSTSSPTRAPSFVLRAGRAAARR